MSEPVPDTAMVRQPDAAPAGQPGADAIHRSVQEHYAAAARAILAGSGAEHVPGHAPGHESGRRGRRAVPVADCCAPVLYRAPELAGLPEPAVLASLGCGNPVAVADLRDGETVLDLGSGGGIDVLLSARRVGPRGHAIGLDMTDEMLALARRNAADAGATNATFLKGKIEAIPLPDASVDVVISNCVVNLAADKAAVFREIARVLRPGGRLGVSDIVATDDLTADERAERGSHVGCIAGALSFGEYASGLRAAGLEAIEIVPTHAVTDGMFAAIVRARKPA